MNLMLNQPPEPATIVVIPDFSRMSAEDFIRATGMKARICMKPKDLYGLPKGTLGFFLWTRPSPEPLPDAVLETMDWFRTEHQPLIIVTDWR